MGVFARNRHFPLRVPQVLGLLAVVALMGCLDGKSADHGKKGPAAVDWTDMAAARASAYVLTSRVFQRALYYKPMETSAPPDVIPLCPLIVQEVDATDRESWHALRPARIELDSAGHWRANIDRPTVYYSETSISIRGTAYRTLSFVWWVGGKLENGNSAPRWRGIVIVFGNDGFPIFQKVIGTADPLEVVFVSESLEQLARMQFGAPLPGRISALEPSAETEPAIVVARILSDGPVPMGPWVYLSRDDATVTTLLCRCMASQVLDFAENNYYELSPSSDLVQLALQNGGPPDPLSLTSLEACISPVRIQSLASRLRIPKAPN